MRTGQDSVFRAIRACRICGNSDLVTVLDLGAPALTGTFPRRGALDAPRAPLELVKCRDRTGGTACGLVQLRHSVEPSLLYGDGYGYRSGLNRAMVDHLAQLAALVADRSALGPGEIMLDIGSNDGTLLRALGRPGVRLIGMDPTARRFAGFYPAEAEAIPEFFSAARFLQESGGRRAKVVASVAMLYDLEQPLAFVEQVRDVLDDEGVWLLEQSYLPSMLARTAYDTVCHEHLEYYALKQVAWLMARAGLRIADAWLTDTNGGSFAMVVRKRRAGEDLLGATAAAMLAEEERLELASEAPYLRFHDRVFEHRCRLREMLRAFGVAGTRIVGYGASTKGNVLLQFCGITPAELPCIADVNPDKYGCVTPGTGIPIVSEDAARAERPDAFLVLPWHFREAIVSREARFLADGGSLVFPLPALEVVPGGGARRRDGAVPAAVVLAD